MTARDPAATVRACLWTPESLAALDSLVQQLQQAENKTKLAIEEGEVFLRNVRRLEHQLQQAQEREDAMVQTERETASDLVDALARAERLETEVAEWQESSRVRYERAEAERERAERLAEALRRIQAIQPETLTMLRIEGVVFEHAPKPNPDDPFELVAFWIYNDLCETEQIAREALAGGGETA